ncbi:hypothetical protein CB0940_07985 [Cercospora beticola]|uniref:Uncharacterized protein n=2 Tax=Cercospora TaxID=29002 RepID=A0A2G5HPZ5_CERBT|nr:hypothetical protein CB0940_07985 [Cercospora beticola]XP_044660187.1 uncharacterized protein CKM354_000885700 [Cercospora kikuchii]PIA94614.1 hypothetical protein CB0940_07985 [Cercospora beticola]WPB04539.1 hypothetical protein RHO25_009185 [Cercospora beticola]CAK1364283.1 unnamed protein product [Cercospora beticola]GIZ45700.1 hypothetical protein CKM354_000885700 [Cercospora kikuchii]
MPTATREIHYVNTKLPKIRTAYQMSVEMPSSPLISANGHGSMLLGPSRELPMPVVSHITSIAQAQATLQHCATRLNKSWQGNPARASPPGSPIDGQEKRHFQRWLEQWEQAFTAYLSLHMSGMKPDEVTRSRILKANHLSCTILASQAGPSMRTDDVFANECQAIVELANAVTVARQKAGSQSPVSSSPGASTLDIREPLYVVVACCNRTGVRNKAIELISRSNPR